jgi:hypothetical protein
MPIPPTNCLARKLGSPKKEDWGRQISRNNDHPSMFAEG